MKLIDKKFVQYIFFTNVIQKNFLKERKINVKELRSNSYDLIKFKTKLVSFLDLETNIKLYHYVIPEGDSYV